MAAISNNEIKKVKALQQKKFRDETGLFIVEGEKMVEVLADALTKNKVYFELHIYPDGCHGLGLASDRNDISCWSKNAVIFLKNLGF